MSAHELEAVRAKIQGAGARAWVYLPPDSPDSPDSNPSEPAWSEREDFLRKAAARTTAALQAAIADGLQTLTAQSAQSAQDWFQHCGYEGSSN